MTGKRNLNGYKDLIIKFLTNEISRSELPELNKWLEEDEEHQYMFNELKQLWLLSGNVSSSQEVDIYKSLDHLWIKIHEKQDERYQKVSFYFKYRKYIAIAASWLIFMAIGTLLPVFERNNSTSHTRPARLQTEITAPLGSKCKIVLPDNTEVWLNAGSKLHYDKTYNLSERLVHLEGEAYFSVAKQKECPFRVKTTDIMITALGTKFNVKAYPEEGTITTTLEEGKIDIKLLSGRKNEEEIVLNPNDNIIYYRADNSLKLDGSENYKSRSESVKKSIPVSRVEINSDINTELYTSWKEERWIFLGEPLPSLTAKLERRFNMRIVFAEELLKEYRFSGTIENETIEQILQALRLTAPLKYAIEKNTVVLSVDYQLVKKYRKIIKPKD